MPATSAILWLIAVALGAWGGSLIVRWFWGDRARGQRRCPICLTRPAATSRTCGACGFTSKVERRFHPPRRRWWVMALGVDAILAAVAAAYLAEVVSSWPQIEHPHRTLRSISEHPPAWTAWGIGLAGAGLLIRGWRGSPSLGRRRCPRCWYDMAGIRLTCPECGESARSATALYRTRRHRRMAAAGAALLATAYAVWVVPRINETGWVGAVPTTALIVGIEWWPEEALWGRSGALRAAIERARSVILRGSDPVQVYAAMNVHGDWRRQPDLVNAAFRCLARELGSADASRRLITAERVAVHGFHARPTLSDKEVAGLLPGLLLALDDDSIAVVAAACRLLGDLGAGAESATDRLVRALGDPSEFRRNAAAAALLSMPHSHATRGAALAMVRGGGPQTRYALRLLARAPSDDAEVTAVLLGVIRGSDHEHSMLASGALRRQAHPAVSIRAMFEQFESSRPRSEEFLRWVYVAGHDADYARELETWMPRLASILTSGSTAERARAWTLLQSLEPRQVDLGAALPAIELMQADPNPEHAAAARHIAARIRSRQAWDAEAGVQEP